MRLLSSLALLLVAAIAGCNGDDKGLVPVSGKVTFAGGPPPANGTITFNPIEVAEGRPRRPGRAQFDKEGAFTVTSYEEGDGLVPGTYHPRIQCWNGTPSSSDPGSYERLNYVPANFEPKPIVVDAESGAVEVTIDVPRKN
jgi:hypothetical protein